VRYELQEIEPTLEDFEEKVWEEEVVK